MLRGFAWKSKSSQCGTNRNKTSAYEVATDTGYVNCHKKLFRIRITTEHKIEQPEEIVIIQKA